jgi:hypothetical protein
MRHKAVYDKLSQTQISQAIDKRGDLCSLPPSLHAIFYLNLSLVLAVQCLKI